MTYLSRLAPRPLAQQAIARLAAIALTLLHNAPGPATKRRAAVHATARWACRHVATTRTR